MAATQLEKKHKSVQVAEQIMEKIVSGEWPVGSKLPGELELTSYFDVSRVSVRQAISQLSGQGILSVVQGSGTYINKVLPEDYLDNALQMLVLDAPDYLEIQEYRLLMEPLIASQVALKATKATLTELAECLDRQEQAQKSGNLEQYLEEDILFHHLLSESINNRIVSKTFNLIEQMLHFAMQHSGEITGFDDGVTFHRSILNCLENRDSEGARATMWCHIQNNIVAYKNRIAKNKNEKKKRRNENEA